MFVVLHLCPTSISLASTLLLTLGPLPRETESSCTASAGRGVRAGLLPVAS